MSVSSASSIRRTAAIAASFALALTACSGGGAATSTETDPEISASTVTNGETVVKVTGTIELKFNPTALTADAGDVTFELTSDSAVPHNLVVEGQNGDAVVVEVDANATASGTITLAAADYVFYCSIAGHREAGMEGTLVVA